MGDLSDNLSRHEFACKCGCGFDTVDVKTLDVIQRVCDYFRTSVIITSGCRCVEHNVAVGGSKNSQHVKARAGDCKFKNTTPEEVYEYLDEKYPDSLGLGLYNTFIHIDTRTGKARWRD